jgi:hypothetical protein
MHKTIWRKGLKEEKARLTNELVQKPIPAEDEKILNALYRRAQAAGFAGTKAEYREKVFDRRIK